MPKPILIYQPKGPAGEYAKWAVNLHNGCTHGCTYCYNRRGVLSHAFGEKPKMKTIVEKRASVRAQKIREESTLMPQDWVRRRALYLTICDLLDRDIDEIGAKQLMDDGGVFFSFKCDPMDASNIDVTYYAVIHLLQWFIPVSILTKSTEWLRESNVANLFLRGVNNHLLTIGFTLTGMDEMERNAPSNAERIHALKILHVMGIKTFVSLEPVVSFDASLRMIEQASLYCKEFRIGLMSPYKKTRYNGFDLVDFIDIVNRMRQELNLDIRWKVSVTEELRKKGIAYTMTDGVLDFSPEERARLDIRRSQLDQMMFGDVKGDQSDFDGLFGCIKKYEFEL